MKKKLSALVLFSLLGLALMAQSCKRSQMEVEDPSEAIVLTPRVDFEPPDFYPEAFEACLTNYFEMQSRLFNDAMFAVIVNASQEIIENGQTNLFNNTHEIGMLFSTVYEPEVAARIECLLNQDICLFFEYLNALQSRNKESAKTILVQLYANGRMLVEFINIMNPYFAYEPEKYMLDEHVTLITDQAEAYLRRDLKRAQELNRRSVKQLKELAVHITKAMVKQYEPEPHGFSETDCERVILLTE